MKSSIFQHLPDVCSLRMLTDKRIWRVCMKHISQDSPSLCNNQMNGVGLGTDGADALKKHFFYFDDVPSNPQNMNFYKDYGSVMGRNNLLNNTCYLTKLLQILDSCYIFVKIPGDYIPIFYFFSASILLNSQCQFGMHIVLCGLHWAITNLLTPYRTSKNYMFVTVLNATPSIRGISLLPIYLLLFNIIELLLSKYRVIIE